MMGGFGYRGDLGEYPCFRMEPGPEEVAHEVAWAIVSGADPDLPFEEQRARTKKIAPVVLDWIERGLIKVEPGAFRPMRGI